MDIVTEKGDLLISEVMVSVRRAVNTNVFMVSRNNHFRGSTVVMMVAMRPGRAADANVIMVARNFHFLVPIVVMVVMG